MPSGRERSLANLRPTERGNVLALKHGASSEAQIRPVARNHKRRVLRQIGLRAADLDPLGRGYLDTYVRVQAKIEAIDAYVADHGLIRADGEPQPVMRLYVSLCNSARLALSRLEAHVQARTTDPVADVQRWLDALPEVEDDDEDEDAPDGT